MDPKPSKRWYFDFDHTLYDTDALTAVVWNDLVELGSVRADIDAAHTELKEIGYTFEGHLKLLGYSGEIVTQQAKRFRGYLVRGNDFLFPNVANTLRHLAETDQCNLLTFGNPDFQSAKFAGATDLHSSIHHMHYVWHHRSKGDVLRDEGGDGHVYFIDDTPRQLLDVQKKAPWVTCIRICWPSVRSEPHPEDDKSWRVIQSLEEL